MLFLMQTWNEHLKRNSMCLHQRNCIGSTRTCNFIIFSKLIRIFIFNMQFLLHIMHTFLEIKTKNHTIKQCFFSKRIYFNSIQNILDSNRTKKHIYFYQIDEVLFSIYIYFKIRNQYIEYSHGFLVIVFKKKYIEYIN